MPPALLPAGAPRLPLGPCRLMTLAAVAFATAACGAAGPGPSDSSPFSNPDVATTIEIRVVNLKFLDARLTAIRRGRRTRIGDITGKTEEVFTMSWTVTDPLQIEIDLVGGGKCTTPTLLTDPGDLIELQIESRLDLSLYCRRGGE